MTHSAGPRSAGPRSAGPPGLTVRIARNCTACGCCLMTCPERALRPAPNRPLVLDAACTGCGLCIEVCPVDAIQDALVGA